jgi:hypothetical protein
MNVLKAVYSTPELKAAVEKEMGESLGHVPPLGMRALLRFGLHGQVFRQVLQAARMMRLAVFTALSGLFLVAPAYFLPACVMLAAWAFLSVVFGGKRVRMCACCCCGATTEDVKNGTLSDEQMCCCCCRGTGVCAVGCADCCGDSGDDEDVEAMEDGAGGCCCCGDDDDCSCCNGADATGTVGACSCCSEGDCSCCTKKASSDKSVAIYEGIPIQIV